MKTVSIARLIIGTVAVSMFGLASASASAQVIVRDSAGVYSAGYTEVVIPPITVIGFSGGYGVTEASSSSLVFFSFSYPCMNWVAGFTVTGNGLEVTKP